ncbi:MAG: ribosomal RNA small subunit methyltransferase I, partial [Gammaproteobacteria bacterium]
MSAESSGTLYVVGTPIGNLDDLSSRARNVLGDVDLIAAEDTRRTRGLLSSINLNTTLIAYHEHNERQQTPALIARLQKGESLALVSDAGMPSISDPGLRLVRAALSEKLPVVSVPGPSAAVAALTISG